MLLGHAGLGRQAERLPKAREEGRERPRGAVVVRGDTLTKKKKKKRSNLICPPDTPRAAGARSLRGSVEVATAPSKRRGRLSRASSRALRAVSDAPKRQDYEWGLLGGVRAGDLQSAAPADGARAQRREVKTRAPAAPVPSSSSTWGGDSTPQGEPRPQSKAPKPPSPTLKPLFLSELSDLRPS